MNVHDLSGVMARAPDIEDESGEAMFRALGPFNGGHAWVGKYKGESSWTCHPDGEATLYTLEGEVSIRLLADDQEHEVASGPGTICVAPAGTWHKYMSKDWVTQFGAMVGTTLHASAENPRPGES